MKHILAIMMTFTLFVLSSFASESPKFTVQQPPQKTHFQEKVYPGWGLVDIRHGYVDFGKQVEHQYLGQGIEKYFDDYLPCLPHESDDCRKLPEKSEAYLYFEKMLGKKTLESMVQTGQAVVYGNKMREVYILNNTQQRNTPEYQEYSEKCLDNDEKICDVLYEKVIHTFHPVINTKIQKQYRITSESDQKIVVKIFPVNDQEYITYDPEPDYTHFAFPAWTFIDPIYDYYRIQISGGNYTTYKGAKIDSYHDIPEYRTIAQEIQRITTSPLTIVAREKQFQEQYEKIFALLNSSDIEEHSPNGLIRPTKKYMITRFTPENYTFPGLSDKFMYNTSYVIVPYYEAEITVQKGENIFHIDYEQFTPDVGSITN